MAKLDDKQFTEIWKQRMVRAYRAKKEVQDRWNIVAEYYSGRYFYDKPVDDQYACNWTFSLIRSITSSLYFQNPKMNSRGLSKVGTLVAPMVEKIMDRERRIIDCESEERRMISNAVKYGTGIMKHGYSWEVCPVPDIADDKAVDESIDIQSSYTASSFSQVDDLSLPQGHFTEHDSSIKEGHPWVKSINPKNFLVDPDCKTFEEARWYCHWYSRPYADVKRDSRYPVKVRKQLMPTGQAHFLDEDELAYATEQMREDIKFDSSLLNIYEVYDKTTNTVYHLTPGLDEPLLEKPYPFETTCPYEFLVLFEDDDSPWGISLPDIFSIQIDTLNKMRTKMVDHVQRNTARVGAYNRRYINEEQMKDALQLPDGSWYGLDNMPQGTKLKDALDMFPVTPINPDLYQLSNLIENDLQEVSGASELGSRTTETATEASMLEQKSNLRVGDMRQRVERALRGSMRKVFSLIRQYWPAERMVPIFGPDGQILQYFEMTKGHMYSEFEIDIEPGSTERVDKNVRTRQLIDAIRELQGLDPLVQQAGGQLNWIEIAQQFVVQTEILKNRDKIVIPPQPQPQPGNMLPFGGDQMSQQPGSANVTNQGNIQQAFNGYDPGRAQSEAGNQAGAY